MTGKIKPPVWFWIVSILALIWNIMGAMAYLMQAMMRDSLSVEDQAMYEAMPAWATAAFAFAVWGGTFGSVFLLLRKVLALPILAISFLGVVVQMIYNLGVAENTTVYGPGEIAMSAMIPLIALLLVMLAKSSKAKGWLA